LLLEPKRVPTETIFHLEVAKENDKENCNRPDKTKMKIRDKKSSLSSAPPPASSVDVIEQRDYKARMSAYSSQMGNDDKDNTKNSGSGRESPRNAEENTRDSETDELVQLLALQSYHLPGNNWRQDWLQFMSNNHPVFGICCHNKVHPIKTFTRIVALIGTVTFGLAITNFFYMFLLWNPEFDRVLVSVATANGGFVLTTGMLLLWTAGGGIHCMFNLAMWHIAACACCQSGGCLESCACCPSLGKYMIRFFVFCIGAFAALIIVLRVAINNQEEEDSIADGDGTIQGIDLGVEAVSEFSFVFNYLVEMTLSFFVYYPVIGTILFSGILSCGYNVPVVGGRPYEVACEDRRNLKRQQKDSKQGSPTSIGDDV
jgi:hypothetical protein